MYGPVCTAPARLMHMHNCIMHNEHTAHPALSTESTQEFPSPLQLFLDTPGDDFYILDSQYNG